MLKNMRMFSFDSANEIPNSIFKRHKPGLSSCFKRAAKI